MISKSPLLPQDCAELTEGFFAIREICETGAAHGCNEADFVQAAKRQLRQVPQHERGKGED